MAPASVTCLRQTISQTLADTNAALGNLVWHIAWRTSLFKAATAAAARSFRSVRLRVVRTQVFSSSRYLYSNANLKYAIIECVGGGGGGGGAIFLVRISDLLPAPVAVLAGIQGRSPPRRISVRLRP